ncbi:MAG TPA: class I SAM-dependent methyltransferase [Steroidobacteraceae bacterium]|jgi:2-polyprenyl-6-hydroxyphenyl methylase/3-demethylubiquinone-9 3-methyltransferase|nr:class I SAM-dependent methyltransferase [Steroidobacteraceae bacterium]
MRIGPLVRRAFGRYERQISNAYRSIYVDLDSFVDLIRKWEPSAVRILEVGCGEGTVTEKLSIAYPHARITAIDITPRVGRLYAGSLDLVQFIQCNVQSIAELQAGQFDLVVLSDVLHHVPKEFRQGLFDAIRIALAPSGSFIFKDWQRNYLPIHWLCHASDRWLTGDRISFLTRKEMREHLALTFGEAALIKEDRVPPWWNNIAILIRPAH